MKWKTTRMMRIAPVALAGVLAAASSQAADTPAKKREKELLQRLKNSDARAAQLQQRLEQLERRVQAMDTASQKIDMPPAAPAVIPAAVTRPPSETAQAAPASPRPPAPENNRTAARSGPGTFEVDEEAAQRALERTLTQTGALLLPQRTVEITPSYSFRRSEQHASALFTVINPATSTSTQVVGNQRSWQNENVLRVDVRAGLPYASQLEFSLPYSYIPTTQATDLGTSTSASGKGIGDATLGIAKTLARESGWKPDLIGRVSYNFGNGKRLDDGISLGGGFRQLSAELVALKRQDPLAFVASAFYGKTFEKDALKPGDTASISLSALLAASPATSLQFGFSQIHRGKLENNGIKLAGSEQTYGVATLGASSVLSRDTTLVTQLGIGLGNDAPKYSFTVSLPILFR